MSPDPLTIATFIGAIIGTASSSFMSYRAQRTSKQAEKNTAIVQTEVMGPGESPSLRDLVQNQHNTVMGEVHNLSVRMKGVESAIYEHVEERLAKLELPSHDSRLVATALQSIAENVKRLTEDNYRNGRNIHRVANACQVKVLSREDAVEEARKEAEESAKQ